MSIITLYGAEYSSGKNVFRLQFFKNSGTIYVCIRHEDGMFIPLSDFKNMLKAAHICVDDTTSEEPNNE